MTRLAKCVTLLATISAMTVVGGCSGHDSDFFPYLMKGLDVWVYNDRTEHEYYGGRIEASYFSRRAALDRCGDAAEAVAREYHLQEWSYICCTVTSSSDCATKVR